MKNFLFAALLIIALVSCSQTETNTEISGNIEGLKKGTLYLQKIEDSTMVTIDSVELKGKSDFTFNTYLESPEMLFLFLRKTEGTPVSDRLDIFAEPGKIQVNTSLKSFDAATVTGSENHAKLEEFGKLMQRFNDRNIEILKENLEAESTGNKEEIENTQRRLNSLLSSRYLTTVNFALNNKGLEIAPYLAISNIYDANIKYLDTIYSVISPEVKSSKYGKKLEDFLKERKKAGI